jgi:hypothetical protein
MQRFILVILACFWAFMGFRLWQQEYTDKRLGAAVNIAVVWDKVLNAQDDAALAMVNEHTGEVLGSLTWAPGVTRDDTVNRGEVEGMVHTVLAYSLDIERGRFFADEIAHDLRFTFHIGFGPPPSREWTGVQMMVRKKTPEQEFEFTLNAAATNDFLTLSLQFKGKTNEVKLLNTDLRKPDMLAATSMHLAGAHPWIASAAALTVRNLLTKEQLEQPLKFELPLPKQAHFDLLPGVRSRIKVYRVDVPLVEGMPVKVYISPFGEILRVEFPEVLIDTLRKSAQLDLPKSLMLLNENYYGKTKRRRNR